MNLKNGQTMETKKTAVEWFISETYHLGGTMIFNNGQRVFYLAIEQYEELLKQAKQMEKEQNREFYNEGKDFSSYIYDEQYGGVEYWDREPMGFEQYYNETYGKY